MAKKMDMTKLDRIREASVEIISEHGILNSSVASIAERAGVSVGYLYRHYPGKVDLINDLLEDALRTITDRIYALADETNDIRKIVRGIVEFIIESAATNRPKHKFLIMLLNDFSVEINPDIRERIRSIGDTLIAVGRKIMFCVTIHPLKICILHWSESPCSTLLRGISSVSGTRPTISGD